MKNLSLCKHMAALSAILTGLYLPNQSEAEGAGESSLAQEIARNRIFEQPIVWVGSEAPSDSETLALSAALEPAQTNRLAGRIEQLEQFIGAHPTCAWTPSVRANLAVSYRFFGYYTRALAHWEESWKATRQFESGQGRRVADFVLANWSGLLSSLGRLEKLRELEAANAGRVLSDLEWERRFSASRRNLRTMESNPGASYRCGTLALINVARTLGVPFQEIEPLKELRSPATGFSLAQLTEIAAQRRLNLVPMRRSSGSGLVVPSVVHFRQNHYAAIIEFREGRCRLTDPTFGTAKWLEADAINEEASGYFLVPEQKKPVGWVEATHDEMTLVFGKGIDTAPPWPEQPPCEAPPFAPDSCPRCKPGGPGSGGGGPGPGTQGGGPGCSSCKPGTLSIWGDDQMPPATQSGLWGHDVLGMPTWSVQEPYISVHLRDVPVSYSPSRGADFAVKMYYGEHEARTTNYFGFGPQWCSGLLSYVHLVESTHNDDFAFKHFIATVYGLGGGQLSFSYLSNLTDSSTFTTFQKVTNGNGPVTSTIVHYPDGSSAAYELGVEVQDTPAIMDFFLTQFTDSHSNTTTFNYSTSNNTVLLWSVVDPDGKANSIVYDTNWITRIARIDTPQSWSAKFYYDTHGVLSSIVDAIGMTNSFQYILTNGYYLITNLTTPYGPTTFSYIRPFDELWGNIGNSISITDNVNRAVTVTEPNGGKHLFMYRDDSRQLLRGGSWVDFLANTNTSRLPDYVPGNITPISVAQVTDWNYVYRNSFYWGPRQYAALSTSDILNLSTNDYRLGRLRNWLHTSDSNNEVEEMVSTTLNMEQDFSPDGSAEGQKTWYGYADRAQWLNYESVDNNFPAYIAQRLPDGGTRYTYTEYNALGFPKLIATTNIIGTNYSQKTRTFTYAANGIDLLRVTNYAGVLEASYSYDANHHRLTATNAVGEVTSYAYDTNGLLILISRPSGLKTTNIYDANLRLSQTIDLEISRTNSFTWTNGQVFSRTDARGLTVTNSWDALRRLTNVAYPDGTAMSFSFDKLDLVQSIDRMGFTNKFSYNAVRQRSSATDARGNTTGFNYCKCGSLDYVTNALGQVTLFLYDNQGKLTNAIHPDAYSVVNFYDLIGQLIRVSDGQGSTTNWYHNRGFLVAVSNAVGRVQTMIYNLEDRATNTVDANGVTVSQTFDDLGRPLTRRYPDDGVETFGYSPSGLIAYTNQLTNATFYAYDAAGRKTAETNANNELTQFSYSAAGDLLTLTDGKTNVTTWHYDQFGRVTNKVDAATNVVFVYTYDPNNRLTNRWTPAKTNTFYKYDNAGNLSNITYAVSHSIAMAYDAMNRLTNMVDAVGTTGYALTSGGLLQAEDGPWANDTVSYTYQNRFRTGLSLQAPDASDWVQNYAYDAAKRLKSLTSPAGTFSYDYDDTAHRLVKKLNLPNGAYITNSFDGVSRMLSTVLNNSTNGILNSHSYGYNQANQRTALTNLMGDYRTYGYDNIGQLKRALGYEPGGGTTRYHERTGYAFDAAGNLTGRTNDAFVETFTVNNLNELSAGSRSGTLTVAGTTTSSATNVTVNTSNATRYADNTFSSRGFTLADATNAFTAVAQDGLGRADSNSISAYLPASPGFTYDLNGNLLSDGRRAFDYDDENQLTRLTVTNSFKSEFAYDGRMRRRIRREYAWQLGAWRLTNEVRYVYDGNLVIQERDGFNLPSLDYTRGKDLTGSLEGAGGIGGLLSMSDLKSSISKPQYFYHADGNGNVTMLINALQSCVAKYQYDPSGNTLSCIGDVAQLNLYRFSSREAHPASGLVHYLYRYYDPSIQRWSNRDPIGELGGVNLYEFCQNSPTGFIDIDGHYRFGWSLIAGVLARLAASVAQHFANLNCPDTGNCEACCNTVAASLGVACTSIGVAGGLATAGFFGAIPIVGLVVGPLAGIISAGVIIGECGRDVAMGREQCLKGCPCPPAPSGGASRPPSTQAAGPYYQNGSGKNGPPGMIIF